MDELMPRVSRLRTAVVSAYLGASDVSTARQVRAAVGHVTLSGRSGRTTLEALAAADDLQGVDLDPADYLRAPNDELTLFDGFDSTARQRDLGLGVVRSPGHHVPRADHDALKVAMTEPVGADVVRVVSLHAAWLRRDARRAVIQAIENCDDHLALVFAEVMDPFRAAETVDGLRDLMIAASDRRLELLRTDMVGVAFAAHGGALGAVGVTASGRHHGLPMSARMRASYEERQRWPLVFVGELLSWHRANELGALEDFGGAGLTDCACEPCDGQSLLRLDQAWPHRVAREIQQQVTMHDLATWAPIARRILDSARPAETWAEAAAAASRKVADVAATYKVALKLPASLGAWT